MASRKKGTEPERLPGWKVVEPLRRQADSPQARSFEADMVGADAKALKSKY